MDPAFPAEYTSTPIRDESENHVGAVVTFQDISERKRMEAQLLEETKVAEVSRVLGDIGHDIKNMVMPVLNGAWLLQDELNELFPRLSATTKNAHKESQELSSEIIEMIGRNAQRIQDRVKEIADAVKGVTTPPRFGPCDISKVVEDVMAALRVYANERGVRLAIQGLDTLPSIQADERRLFNAFYNLINNAIPEVPKGGTVAIYGHTQPDGKSIQVSVMDTGRGMPPEIRESLFTIRAITSKTGGTGLGTKIVKDVITAHQGTITVESEEGSGTTFHVTLPIQGPS